MLNELECEYCKVAELLDELCAIEILREHAPPYLWFLVDRLESSLRRIDALEDEEDLLDMEALLEAEGLI